MRQKHPPAPSRKPALEFSVFHKIKLSASAKKYDCKRAFLFQKERPSLIFLKTFRDTQAFRAIQISFPAAFLEGAWGNQSQEQTRRVCDAGTANVARGVSMRKPSGVGHTMPLQRMVSPYIYSIGYSIDTPFLRKYFPQASTSLK